MKETGALDSPIRLRDLVHSTSGPRGKEINKKNPAVKNSLTSSVSTCQLQIGFIPPMVIWVISRHIGTWLRGAYCCENFKADSEKQQTGRTDRAKKGILFQ